MRERMLAGPRYARDAGLRPTMILWQQGEAEAGNPPQPANGLVWQAVFESIVKSLSDNGVGAPIYVANSTGLQERAPNAIIRAAQSAVVNHRDVLGGPDPNVTPLRRMQGRLSFSTAMRWMRPHNYGWRQSLRRAGRRLDQRRADRAVASRPRMTSTACGSEPTILSGSAGWSCR